jgi:hypothetical protein
MPTTPIIGRSADVFDHDYCAVLDSADVDGDGRDDLIAGGYVTGRIFVYRNTGRDRVDGLRRDTVLLGHILFAPDKVLCPRVALPPN